MDFPPSVTHTHTHARAPGSHLVVVLARQHVGEGDLGLEHLAAVHELHQQVTHCLELHPLGRFDVGQDETRKDLEERERPGETASQAALRARVRDPGTLRLCDGTMK